MTTQLFTGDCLLVMADLANDSIDAIVTDPPYGLGFMGKSWDKGVPGVEFWLEMLRVAKPGAYLLAFGGTRTSHRMACAIEDAGWEIRDTIMWLYGCLDEATEVATEYGVTPYHKTKIGDRVLCYDVEHGEYSYQPILEIVEYDYSDTAFRLVGDFGEQVVSRNHRVIVECGGSEAFQLAETLECEARVPVLENLPALRQAVHDAHQGASRPQQDVQRGLREGSDRRRECRGDAVGAAQGRDDQVCGLWGERLETGCVASQGGDTDLQPEVQWSTSRRGVGDSRAHRSGALVGRVGGGAEGPDDGRIEPGVEGRADLSESKGCVYQTADQVCALSCANAANGAVGRVRDGAPATGGAGDRSSLDASGVCSPHQPRRDGQPAAEPDAVRHERAAQGVRAWGGHRSAMVRVVPFHYTGKVWCLRVPTGAFVAVRNGVAFPTGNSGFPKSLDVAKAIDKAAGAERERGPVDPARSGRLVNQVGGSVSTGGQWKHGGRCVTIDPPATDAARQHAGRGTALKPAFEPIIMARKPMVGTVAANVLAYGTGALNIDLCRVPAPPEDLQEMAGRSGGHASFGPDDTNVALGKWLGRPVGELWTPNATGRWPANVIHDGSEEVMAAFPQVRGATSRTDTVSRGMFHGGDAGAVYDDDGNTSAARFFYCAKASRKDRNEGCEGLPLKAGGMLSNTSGQHITRRDGGAPGPVRNNHPTVKPTPLMRYLVRLVTPKGGTVLDPFAGSGSTGKAAVLEWINFIGIELEAEYVAIAQARIAYAEKESA